MKDLRILIFLPILLILVIFIESKKTTLEAGDLAFISYNSRYDDSFSIITLKEIHPNTSIYFTDDEWNGNRFKLKEGDLIWNSGNQIIKSRTIIHFESIKNKPIANYGSVSGLMNLSQQGDAIFAYIGENVKQPTRFIAAVTNDKNKYGTLDNTNLEEGKTAITYPIDTYYAKFNAQENFSKEILLSQLNNFNNYYFNTSNTSIARNKRQ